MSITDPTIENVKDEIIESFRRFKEYSDNIFSIEYHIYHIVERYNSYYDSFADNFYMMRPVNYKVFKPLHTLIQLHEKEFNDSYYHPDEFRKEFIDTLHLIFDNEMNNWIDKRAKHSFHYVEHYTPKLHNRDIYAEFSELVNSFNELNEKLKIIHG